MALAGRDFSTEKENDYQGIFKGIALQIVELSINAHLTFL